MYSKVTIINCMSLAKHGLPLQHPLTSKILNMVRRVPHVPGSRKIAIIHWTKAQMRTIKPLNVIRINVGGSCLVEGSSVMWNAMPMTTFCFSELARNFHSASSTFTGFGAPSLVNLILWNRVQGWSWLMIQLAAQSDSKTLLPDDLWPALWSRLECGCLTYERSELPTIWHLNLQLSSKTLASGNSEDQQNQQTAPPFSPFCWSTCQNHSIFARIFKKSSLLDSSSYQMLLDHTVLSCLQSKIRVRSVMLLRYVRRSARERRRHAPTES